MMLSISSLLIGASTVAAALSGWGLRAWRGALHNRRKPAADTLTDDERGELSELRRECGLLDERCRHWQHRARENELELTSLTYSVSHDVRAPLRGIEGFSQALVEDYGQCLDGTAHDYLRRVRADAVHMSGLIDDLTSLARVARAPFRTELMDVSALARGIARDLSAAEPLRRVRWDIPANIAAVADRDLLAEALRQLLANAWKFTSTCDIAQISLGSLPPDPEHPAGTIFQVRDNGAGFDMKYVGKLFGAFQRMHTPEEFSAGRGIGLAMVQRIVRRHGGQLWADATPGHGARFSFTLEGAETGRAANTLSTVETLTSLPVEVGASSAALPKATTV